MNDTPSGDIDDSLRHGTVDAVTHPRGKTLSHGFEPYLTPTRDSYAEVLERGLISLDTNVLLDFYRFAKVTRADLVGVLARLGERLYVSHQVVEEFWRNREGTLEAFERSLAEVKTKISSLKQQGEESVRQWANVISLPPKDLSEAVSAWTKGVESLANRLDQLGARHKSATSFDTNEDEVLKELASLLDGRVGSAPSEAEEESRRLEGARRQTELIPPGFKDKGKSSDLALGDFLLWADVMEEARYRGSDLLLVTRDSKEDWWHKGGGHPLPRRELQAEFHAITGRRLYMLKTSDFLRLGAKVFGLHVREESITDADQVGRRVRRSLGGGRSPIDKLGRVPEGQTLLSLIEFMVTLAYGEPTYDELVERYQQAFPTITLNAEARRRIDNLFSLGLLSLQGDVVMLTSAGRDLEQSHDVAQLQQAFLSRIHGGEEVLSAVKSGRSLNSLKDDPPAGISSTQVGHVFRWLSGLGLIDEDRQASDPDDNGNFHAGGSVPR